MSSSVSMSSCRHSSTLSSEFPVEKIGDGDLAAELRRTRPREVLRELVSDAAGFRGAGWQ